MIDLHCDLCPITTKNFLKLCKVRHASSFRRLGEVLPCHARASSRAGESVQQLHFLLLRQRFYHPDGRSDGNRQGWHFNLRDDVRGTGQIFSGEARAILLRCMGPFKHIAVHLPSAGRAPPEEADARQDGDGFHGKRWREYVRLPPSLLRASEACVHGRLLELWRPLCAAGTAANFSSHPKMTSHTWTASTLSSDRRCHRPPARHGRYTP